MVDQFIEVVYGREGVGPSRSGTGIWWKTGLPRSMALGIAASAKEMESNARNSEYHLSTEVRKEEGNNHLLDG